MLDPTTIGRREEVYSFYAHDGREFHFAIARMLTALLANPKSKCLLRTITMPDKFDEYLIETNGAELDRLDTLTAEDLKVPCITLVMENGMNVLADGTHRIIKLYRQGANSFKSFVVPPDIWELFQIDIHTGPMSRETLHKHTGGMLAHRKRDA